MGGAAQTEPAYAAFVMTFHDKPLKVIVPPGLFFEVSEA
jgi:hypothetical protein